VEITISWMMMLVAQSALAGTPLAFSRAKTAGMSLVRAAADSTSAQISDQVRYAPSTEMSRPTLTKIAPQRPTTASSTAAIDGWRMPAMSARSITAKGSRVTSTISVVTTRNPVMVAAPTSLRSLA